MSEGKQFIKINITLNEARDVADKEGVVVLPMQLPVGMEDLESSIRIAGERFQNMVSYYKDKYDQYDVPKGGYIAMAGLYLSYKYLKAEKNADYEDLLPKLKDLNMKIENILAEKY